MRALELRAYDAAAPSLALVQKPVPRPGPGQVLVRIAASPINPSDLAFVRGMYGARKPLPVTPGVEASGTVVAAGKGLYPRFLVGKRVACVAGEGDGAWAEYMVTRAMLCMPLPSSVSLETGAMTFVNPLTAWALMEIARKEGRRGVVQTAAASALGRMVLRLGKRRRTPVIHVVRRLSQVELLRGLGAGADMVLDSSQPDFDERLRAAAHRWHATIAFDAVAGPLTGRILQAMPRRSRVIVYGGLSLEACRVDARQFIFEHKRIEGFWLSQPAPLSTIDLLRGMAAVRSGLAADFQSEVRLRLPLEAAAQGLEQYAARMTEGKVLLTPQTGG
ncbi:MAG: zinc-binding dehydrogenase [Armatimonadota bacterium]